MNLKLVTAPAAEPLTLVECKAHLRVDSSDEDPLISSYLTAAREMCELETRRAFVTQTFELAIEDWPIDGCLPLPRPPLQSVISITYWTSDNTQLTLSAADYLVDTVSEPGVVRLGYNKRWPSATLRPGPAITLRYVAGYGLAAAVPQRYTQAILLLTGHFYENREQVATGVTVVQMPDAVRWLLQIDRGWF